MARTTAWTKEILRRFLPKSAPNHSKNRILWELIRSGKTDPVQFKGVFNRALFAYLKMGVLQAVFSS